MTMADLSAYHSVFNADFVMLEPLVFLGDEVYAASERANDGVTFVTWQGHEFRLRWFCSRRTLEEQSTRLNFAIVREQLRAELTRSGHGGLLDDLRFFIEGLVPDFQHRDWLEHFEPESALESCQLVYGPDLAAEIDELARGLPKPVMPSPSYLLLGRFRHLRPTVAEVIGDHVRTGNNGHLAPTGVSVPLGYIERRWQKTVENYVTRTAKRLTGLMRVPTPSPALAAARQEMAATGSVQRGDLLFLDGQPARVGHILPPHYNKVLGRICDRDLAMMTVLSRPPSIGSPQVFMRDEQGIWNRHHLEHGLCLGSSVPALRPETPGLALLAYLRWAAWRIASNGIFHVDDR
jgi:hypothetical protein